MIGTVRSWFNVALLTAGIGLAQTTTLVGGDWEVIKISGHDYLTVENILWNYRSPVPIYNGTCRFDPSAVGVAILFSYPEFASSHAC